MLLTHTIAMTKARALCLTLFERNVKSLNLWGPLWTWGLIQMALLVLLTPFSSWLLANSYLVAKEKAPGHLHMWALDLILYCLHPWKSPGKWTSEGRRTLEFGLRVLNALGFRAPISGISHLVQVLKNKMFVAHPQST